MENISSMAMCAFTHTPRNSVRSSSRMTRFRRCRQVCAAKVYQVCDLVISLGFAQTLPSNPGA